MICGIFAFQNIIKQKFECQKYPCLAPNPNALEVWLEFGRRFGCPKALFNVVEGLRKRDEGKLAKQDQKSHTFKAQGPALEKPKRNNRTRN